MRIPLPEMRQIPAGYFIMGSIPKLDSLAFEDEHPIHAVYLTDFLISRAHITNAQYAAFVTASGHRAPDGWYGRTAPRGKEDHPVVNVSWQDAFAYCRWLSEETGAAYRLPTEAEWEKAARGPNARLFPWGYEWNDAKCNTKESGVEETTPVGYYEDGNSIYDVLDMAGNVLEWTSTLWGNDRNIAYTYPYAPDDGREDGLLNDRLSRVARGGSFLRSFRWARCSSRVRMICSTCLPDLGFRVALDLD